MNEWKEKNTKQLINLIDPESVIDQTWETLFLNNSNPIIYKKEGKEKKKIKILFENQF